MATVEVLEGLSRAQAARRLGIASETISKYARSGRLPYIATPLGRVYKVEDVERLRLEREARKKGKKDD